MASHLSVTHCLAAALLDSGCLGFGLGVLQGTYMQPRFGPLVQMHARKTSFQISKDNFYGNVVKHISSLFLFLCSLGKQFSSLFLVLCSIKSCPCRSSKLAHHAAATVCLDWVAAECQSKLDDPVCEPSQAFGGGALLLAQ